MKTTKHQTAHYLCLNISTLHTANILIKKPVIIVDSECSKAKNNQKKKQQQKTGKQNTTTSSISIDLVILYRNFTLLIINVIIVAMIPSISYPRLLIRFIYNYNTGILKIWFHISNKGLFAQIYGYAVGQE